MGGEKKKKKEAARTSGSESKKHLVSLKWRQQQAFSVSAFSQSNPFKWMWCFFFFSVLPPCSIFPSPEQNPGLSHYQGSLNTGGSLPDLSNLHFPSPLSTPLDPEDNGGYPNLSGGSSTGNLPAAMMHLGIGNSQGGWSTAACVCVLLSFLTHRSWSIKIRPPESRQNPPEATIPLSLLSLSLTYLQYCHSVQSTCNKL